MDRPQFDILAENIIRRVGHNLRKKYPVDWCDGWETRVYEAYEEERAQIRTDMGLDPNSLGEHRIDRHKIAAAMAYAILQCPPLEEQGDDPAPGARMANEFLALHSGILIIMHFVEQRLEELAPAERQKLKGVMFAFPAAHEGHYTLHLAKALRMVRTRGANLYLLANILFVVESRFLNHCGVSLPVLTPGAAELQEN